VVSHLVNGINDITEYYKNLDRARKEHFSWDVERRRLEKEEEFRLSEIP
jgi:hypothetical protein